MSHAQASLFPPGGGAGLAAVTIVDVAQRELELVRPRSSRRAGARAPLMGEPHFVEKWPGTDLGQRNRLPLDVRPNRSYFWMAER